MKKTLLPILLVLAACASKPLTAQEKSVRILKKSDAPSNCIELSKVHAPGLGSMTEQGREDDLKRATYAAGGNLVTLDSRDENNTLFGTAWKCK